MYYLMAIESLGISPRLSSKLPDGHRHRQASDIQSVLSESFQMMTYLYLTNHFCLHQLYPCNLIDFICLLFTIQYLFFLLGSNTGPVPNLSLVTSYILEVALGLIFLLGINVCMVQIPIA